MELKVSIFDILSYLIPGVIYFLVIIVIGDYFTDKNLFIFILNVSNFNVLFILTFSYILGHALQPFHKINFLKFLFNNKKNNINILQPLIDKINPEIINIIENKQYSKRAILERILKLHNENLAKTSSRFLALALFVRNLSFPFLLLSIVTPLTYQYFNTTIICLLSFLFLLLSVSLLYKYQRYEIYAFKSVAEGIIALNLKNFNFIKI